MKLRWKWRGQDERIGKRDCEGDVIVFARAPKDGTTYWKTTTNTNLLGNTFHFPTHITNCLFKCHRKLLCLHVAISQRFSGLSAHFVSRKPASNFNHKAKKKLHILMSLSNRLGCESCAAKKAFNLIFSEVGGAKRKLYHISSR